MSLVAGCRSIAVSTARAAAGRGDGVRGPRRAWPGRGTGDPKIYVTDRSGNKVSVVDAGSNAVVGTIPVTAPYEIATTSSPTPGPMSPALTRGPLR
ncbi:hypothetical protein MXD62_22010 [Frankia sp. Mgl5]|uniref:hypothetical protein n=1 Tax=Frankia sp. Mgl5 TaxID=2933793 RepID=UPI00200F8A9E|nr:hypothetical protein [Frankia sp. Mgl5]MCK9929812.1 hypothetical protein [Frankia sp. Mgl5]